MFEPVLVAEALRAAVPPAPPSPGAAVDAQQIMGVVGGIISGIVLGLGALFYKGANSAAPKQPAPSLESVPTLETFAQGPYQAILDRLAAVAMMQERLAGSHFELREAIAEALRVTRHDLKGELQAVVTANERDAEEIKLIARELDAVLGRLDEFVRAKIK